MFVTCFLLCWRFCFLFPPNLLSFLPRFPSPLSQVSQDTSVSDTSVSPGQVSLHTNICRCDIKISQKTYLYTSILPSFTLVYSQTHSLEARLWESEATANSPLSKKRALRCLLLFFLRVTETAHRVHMAANVGPKSTIRVLYWQLT